MCRLARHAVVAAAFAAVALAFGAAAGAADARPSAIGVVGGSLPADGDISAVERLPAYFLEARRYGFGRPATAADIAAWDIDVRHDGAGLPPGQGDIESGADVYDEKCALCHGDFGQGEGRWPVLSGGFETLTNQGGTHRPEKTVGSYWPYAPTLFDYIRRAMPYTAPQTLDDDETYALVAYILHLNGLADEGFVADADSLADFAMPNRDNFYIDDRPDVAAAPCMRDCLDEDALALIETIKGVTPLEHLAGDNPPDDAPTAEAENSGAAPTAVAARANYRQFCAACHDNAIAGAPPPQDADAWRERLRQSGGADGLTRSAIVGKGAMPPKGGAMALSDEEIALIVDFMVADGK